jgi:hypothetical protein
MIVSISKEAFMVLSTHFLSEKAVNEHWSTIEKGFITYVRNTGSTQYHSKEYRECQEKIKKLCNKSVDWKRPKLSDPHLENLFIMSDVAGDRRRFTALYTDQYIAAIATLLFLIATLGVVIGGIASTPLLCVGTPLFTAYIASSSTLGGLTLISWVGYLYNENKRHLLYKEACNQITANATS